MKGSFYSFVLAFAVILSIQCAVPGNGFSQDTTRVDSTLLKQIQQEMQQDEQKGDDAQAGISDATLQARTGRTSNDLNPEISAITDFRSMYTNEGSRNFDAVLQGVELSFKSAIDPYARAEIYPVFEVHDGEMHATIEEAFLQTLSMPANLQLKAGKFRQTFGRVNPVHRHALPVIDVPVAYENFFGEAMIDEGFSLSWLVPNPSFYQELVFELTRGPEESPLFARSEGNQLLKLAHLKNFWALGDNSTLELGLSGAVGENDSSLTTRIGGIDLTYKWKPLRRNTYKSFEWQTELYFSNAEQAATEDVNAWGMYSWMQYQLSRRWFLGGMYSYSNRPFEPDFEEQAISSTLGWYATEFQKLEIGPKLVTTNGFDDTAFSLRFRWVFVIGAHGAHQY